jgi:hypothetical protein
VEGTGVCVICSEFAKGKTFSHGKLNQDNDNQDEMSYILRTHMVKNGNPICEHGMDTRRENKDTQKYAENYNQE